MTPAPVTGRRDRRIDFWRGSAILMIFINHLDANILSVLTTRSWGFSDAAELFVFLGGLTTARVLTSRRFAGLGAMGRYLARRVVRLYLFHLLLLFALALVCLIAWNTTGADDFVRELHFESLFVETAATLIRTATLTYLPAFTDVLPLYIVLTIIGGALIAVSRGDWRIMLGASLVVYLVAVIFGLNLPADATGRTWYFNPFCWQLLFVTGGVVWLQRENVRFQALLRAPAMLAVSGVVVGLGIFEAAPWSTGGFLPKTGSIEFLIPLADKHNLSPVRYLHFLAMAHIAYVVTGPALAQRTERWFTATATVGEHALGAFVFGTILATAVRAYTWTAAPGATVNAIFALLGVAGIFVFARLLNTWKRANKARAGLASG
jgi:hypothetical protein